MLASWRAGGQAAQRLTETHDSNRANRNRILCCPMKAALIDRYGSNNVVRVADVEIPTMGVTDVLVRVHAASVNPVDIKTRDGKLKTLFKFRFPLVLGNDLAGVVSD